MDIVFVIIKLLIIALVIFLVFEFKEEIKGFFSKCKKSIVGSSSFDETMLQENIKQQIEKAQKEAAERFKTEANSQVNLFMNYGERIKGLAAVGLLEETKKQVKEAYEGVSQSLQALAKQTRQRNCDSTPIQEIFCFLLPRINNVTKKYLRDCKAGNVSPNNERAYVKMLKSFQEKVEEVNEDFDTEHEERFSREVNSLTNFMDN